MRQILMFVNLFVFIQGQVPVRLAGINATYYQGRVEVYYNYTWGTICDDEFDIDDARVICRMLKFQDVISLVPSRTFGPGTGPIWIDELACDGTEQYIDQCRHYGWGRSNCNHTEDVGIKCLVPGVTDCDTNSSALTRPEVQPNMCPSSNQAPLSQGNIRLVGPLNVTGQGFVQVYYNNSWRAVCDDRWDAADARVVCRMLCYNPAYALSGAPSHMNYLRQNLTNNYALDDVQCSGNESTISECPHRTWGVTDCGGPTELAGVICTPFHKCETNPPTPILECDDAKMKVSFSRHDDPNLRENDLGLFNTFGVCNVQKSTDRDYVTITIPVGECGTDVTTNSTHIFYSNVIRYDYTTFEGYVVRRNAFRVDVSCSFPRQINAHQGVAPLTELVTVAASGTFRMKMEFYQNEFFVERYERYPINLTLGECLNVGVALVTLDPDLKLVVSECTATPTQSIENMIRYTVYNGRCEDSSNGLIYFGTYNDTSYWFRYKTFKFRDYGIVYMHCKAIVCQIAEKDDQCDRSCGSKRKRRSTTITKHIYDIISPPIYLQRNISDDGIFSPTTTFSTEPILTTSVVTPTELQRRHTTAERLTDHIDEDLMAVDGLTSSENSEGDVVRSMEEKPLNLEGYYVAGLLDIRFTNSCPNKLNSLSTTVFAMIIILLSQ